jgi:O-methyltransferase domain/Dimerisation domain
MEDDLTYDQLVLIAGGHTAFQLLWAGLELGVFSALSKSPGMSKATIAQRIGVRPQPAQILLTGLTALKLLVKNGDSYRNSALIEKLGVPESPENMIDVMGWQAHIVYPAEMDLVEALRKSTNVGLSRFPGEGNTLYQRLAHDPRLEAVFQKAMSSLSRSANNMLAAAVDLSGVHHLVDAGGGDATNAIVLARKNPHLKATVFDSPSVCKRAEENVARSDVADRVFTHPGNFFADPYPPGVDCVLFSHILTIWSRERNIALLKKAHAALPDGGRVIIFNMMGSQDEDGPLATALGSPYFLCLASGEGMLYSWSQYEEFLVAAGFMRTLRHALPRDHGVLIGVKEI